MNIILPKGLANRHCEDGGGVRALWPPLYMDVGAKTGPG
jgi:hypothetical protein